MISRRLLPASVLLLLLGACSGSQGTTEEEASGPADKDPPGVAQALSLGGQLEEDSESSAYDRAIGCAAAPRVLILVGTSERASSAAAIAISLAVAAACRRACSGRVVLFWQRWSRGE